METCSRPLMSGAITHPLACDDRGISQLYRSPDTTSLVARLKEQCKGMQASRDQAALQLDALQQSLR